MLSIVAPGQGSQTPGFLNEWLEDPALRDAVQTWSEAISLDLVRLGTTADGDEIRDTSNAQPLLVAAALMSGLALGASKKTASLFAGHSVGEIGAASLAGVLSAEDALRLVRLRGTEMAAAAAGTNTGMSAVLGGDREVVLARLTELGLTAANENGAGQIVAAGALDALAQLGELPPEGSRVRPLAVSGAFHTAVMQPAVAKLAEFVQGIEVHAPAVPILSNKDGTAISDGTTYIDRIVGQIAGPVRWDLCMETLAAMGVTGVIELPPAGTLVGLLKRATPSIETFALKSPADLPAARAFAEQHASSSKGDA